MKKKLYEGEILPYAGYTAFWLSDIESISRYLSWRGIRLRVTLKSGTSYYVKAETFRDISREMRAEAYHRE